MSDRESRIGLLHVIPLIFLIALVVYFFFGDEFKSVTTTTEDETQVTESPAKKERVTDLRTLAQDVSLAKRGRQLFQINCATCHGPEGKGDGPRAATLNPMPRNYTEEKFKHGNDVVSIYKTLMQGSPGTSMPSFSLLPVEDVWAMVHFVRTQIPNPTPTSANILAKLPESPESIDQAESTHPRGERIPILFAMERMAEAESLDTPAAEVDMQTPGARTYLRHCASCHGEQGQGTQIDWISVDPFVYERTSSLADITRDWYSDRSRFGEIVTQGLPGRIMPGVALLTEDEIDDLYEFVRSFADSQ